MHDGLARQDVAAFRAGNAVEVAERAADVADIGVVDVAPDDVSHDIVRVLLTPDVIRQCRQFHDVRVMEQAQGIVALIRSPPKTFSAMSSIEAASTFQLLGAWANSRSASAISLRLSKCDICHSASLILCHPYEITQRKQYKPMPNTIVLDEHAQSVVTTFIAPGEGTEYAVLNQHTVCLLSQEQTDGRFFAVSLHHSAQHGGRRCITIDSRTTTYYILSGRFEFRDGSRPVMVRAGTCVYAPHGSPHTFKNVGSTPGQFLWIVTPGGFEDFFRGPVRTARRAADVGRILEIAARHRIVFAARPGSPD